MLLQFALSTIRQSLLECLLQIHILQHILAIVVLIIAKHLLVLKGHDVCLASLKILQAVVNLHPLQVS